MEFQVKGKYKAGKIGKNWCTFSKVVDVHNEKNAKEVVYSLMGSEHGLTRNFVVIEEVKAVE
jgi:large subunit ribosomal protein LX